MHNSKCPEKGVFNTPKPPILREWYITFDVNRNYDINHRVLAILGGIPIEEVKKVDEMITAIIELYVLFGMTKPRPWRKAKNLTGKKAYLTQLCNQAKHRIICQTVDYVIANGEGSWAKLFKWKFASFFAYYRNQDIPLHPLKCTCNKKSTNWIVDASTLLGGLYRGFERRVRNEFSDKTPFETFLVSTLGLSDVAPLGVGTNVKQRFSPGAFMQFCDTSQQLKKAAPDVPTSMIEKAIDTTVKELTGTPVQKGDCGIKVMWTRPARKKCCTDLGITQLKKEVVCSVDRVKQELRRTVREIFFNRYISYRDFIEPFFPSTSANYINSRGECGSLNCLYERCSFGKMGDGIGFGIETCSLFQRFSPHYGDLGRSEDRKILIESQLGYELPELASTIIADTSALRASWEESYWKIYDLARVERPFVSPVGLAEPLKVRVISKGPPFLYTFLKPVQKWLWGTLKEHKVFSLIGRYVLPEDVQRVLGPHMVQNDEEALSGDYVSSTNRLHSWVSETILDQLMIEIGEAIPFEELDRFPQNFLYELRTMMRTALTKHTFVKEELTHTEYLDQTEGQLMGSIVSFPILCIANAALCRMSLEDARMDHQQYRLIDHGVPNTLLAPLLVNGDDCLLRGARGILRPIWEGHCAMAGLESSVGKTYFSQQFCTINSTIFDFDLKNRLWVESKYVNLGLMRGKKRIGAGGKKLYSPQVPLHQLGTIARELKRSCPENLWPEVKKRFIYYNSRELNRHPLPWFVPEWLGGIGLPLDRDNEISDLDRCAASYLKLRFNDKKFRVIAPKDAAMWLMHKKVQSDLDILNTEECHSRYVLNNGRLESIEENYAKLYKLMTINLLMRDDLGSLYSILKEDRSSGKALLHNSDIWRHARKLTGCGPMSNEDMAYEVKRTYNPIILTEKMELRCHLGHILPEVDESL